MPNGQNKRKTIGKHGVFTLEQARTEAKRLLLLISQGVDPVAEKKQIKNDFNFEKEINQLIPNLNLAYQNYKCNKELAGTTIEAYDRCLNDYLKIGKKSK